MVDVFFRAFIGSGGVLRYGLSIACHARWKMQADARVECIYGMESDFHVTSKREAERRATTDIYVIADDDCLILGKNFISDGVFAMERFKEYGLLTATSISDGEFQESRMYPPPIERHAVGGVVFVRRGILKDFDIPDAAHTDGAICDEMKRRGYKTGVLPWVRMNHLGAGYSLTSPHCWSA